MGKVEIEHAVHAILVEQFRCEKDALTPGASFKDIGLDSLDIVSFVMALEDRFGVDIPESELEGVELLCQAIDLLEEKVGASA